MFDFVLTGLSMCYTMSEIERFLTGSLEEKHMI
jgi:hypothetical protein